MICLGSGWDGNSLKLKENVIESGYAFVRLTLARWSTRCYMVSSGSTCCFNNRPHEKIEIESLLLTGPEEVHGMPWEGHIGRSRQRADRETDRQNLGYMPLLGSMNEVLRGSQANDRLVNSNSKVLVSPWQFYQNLNSHGQRSLVHYSSWSCKSWTTRLSN